MTRQRVDRPPYVNAYGVPVRGFESAQGGLYKGEHVALEVSAPDGLVHALVRFADVQESVVACHDPQGGISWDGFSVRGDAASIREVKRLIEFAAARKL